MSRFFMVQCVHISSIIRIYRAVPLEHFTARVQYSIELLIPYSDTRPVPEAAIYYTVARNKRMVLHSVTVRQNNARNASILISRFELAEFISRVKSRG